MYLLRLAMASLANRRFTAFLTAFAIALSVCLLLAVERVRTEARAWLGSRDFEAVCDLATLDHERVLRVIERLRPIAAARRAARRIADGLRVTTRRTAYKKRGAAHRRRGR